MSSETVHTFGGTAYLIFMLLFLWMSTIPRTNSGAGWWALSIGCTLLARVGLFVSLPTAEQPMALPLYVVFISLEKPLLLTGLTRFLNLATESRWFWLASLAAGLWLVTTMAAGFSHFARAMVFCSVNAALLLYMGWIALKKSAGFPRWPLAATAAASFALAAHWLSGPLLIDRFPSWANHGFVLGTVLVLAQYFALMAAVLAQFQTRLIEAESKALELAFLDPLTGLNNQRYMSTLFEQALVLATRPHHVVAVFYIDLDNFKPINDSAGHAVGDEVLKAVAARLKGNTRSTDICARVGGDEFVVIATQLDEEAQAGDVAKKLLARLTERITVDGRDYALGASIGVALYPQHGKNLAELVQRADKAMYQVKRNGKSGCEIFADASATRAGTSTAA